ncbi:MAG: hypothetical protein PHR26_03370 [Candidatus ainarchaeum sp.]|nr:hypothetical protein [Candidatus ainarchaeum sp.]MDD3975943.1 hypothetical protein [Candidatus ainarchaeum sp.]
MKTTKLEEELILELLRLSSLPKVNDLKFIIEKLSKSDTKILSKEFILISSKIKKGHLASSSLDLIKNKYHSRFISNFIDLLELIVKSGTVSIKDFRNLANNFLKSKEIINERKSILLMQKYTIIFAGGIIVPAILGIVVSLVSKLSSSLDITLLGLSSNLNLYNVSYYCSIIYIIEYIIISSIYLSFLEDNSKKFVVYLVLFLPVSILIFFTLKYLI